MFKNRIVCLLAALACVLGLAGAAVAAEVDCDATYCFSPGDFSESEELAGICVTALPDPQTGTVLLGTRVLQAGDILTADQLAQLTFNPLRTETDRDAVMTYLPIYENRVEKSATMTISIRGKEDKAPVAEDLAIETYKNLPNEAMLKVTDPEGQALTYTVVRQPKRGEVVIREDGSFLYTPKKNKVGIDSFTFTAADPAGNVSREATVTIQILKPTGSRQYTDTVGQDCRFEAEWLKNTGLFEGETVSGAACFYPEKTVSRGEFLAMVVKALEIPMEEDASYAGVSADTPDWLKPYVAAAIRAGLTAGLPDQEFDAADAITGGEAAVLLQNVLDLTVSADRAVNTAAEDPQIPDWAASSVNAMADNGIILAANEPVTRGTAAQVLYQAARLAENAPGMVVLRLR